MEDKPYTLYVVTESINTLYIITISLRSELRGAKIIFESSKRVYMKCVLRLRRITH